MRYNIERWIKGFSPFGFCPNGEVFGTYGGLPAVTSRAEHRLLPIGDFADAFPLGASRHRAIVAGHGRTAAGVWHAMVWWEGILQDLGEGAAKGVDDRDRVGGNQGGRACRWYPDGSRWLETVDSFIYACDSEGNLFGDREDQPCVWNPAGKAKMLPMPGSEWLQGFALGQDARGRVIGTVCKYESEIDNYDDIDPRESSADVIWTDEVPEIVHSFSILWGGFRQINPSGLILLQQEIAEVPSFLPFAGSPALYGPGGLVSLERISTSRFDGNRLNFEKARAVDLHASGRILLEQGEDAVVLVPLSG